MHLMHRWCVDVGLVCVSLWLEEDFGSPFSGFPFPLGRDTREEEEE
ncbi:hypothetical protein Dimus_039628 [Dionaea muscipula]